MSILCLEPRTSDHCSVNIYVESGRKQGSMPKDSSEVSLIETPVREAVFQVPEACRDMRAY